MWSFAKLPSDPLSQFGLAFSKKIPIFFLKIASLMAETNFTLGPTSKTNKFHLLFLVIVGQNSQHKRANLNGRTPLDIYSNNFRPSVKHVLGVLEWFYMPTENWDRPPPVWQKTRLFPDFFSEPFSYCCLCLFMFSFCMFSVICNFLLACCPLPIWVDQELAKANDGLCPCRCLWFCLVHVLCRLHYLHRSWRIWIVKLSENSERPVVVT